MGKELKFKCPDKLPAGPIDCGVGIEWNMPPIVQLLNPRTNRYVKVDTVKGMIISTKKSKGSYKNIPIAIKRDINDIIPYANLTKRICQ